MNEFTFENQGTNTYLVYTISPEDIVDSMSLGMLTNNKIPGLATTLFTQMDATKYIKYNVSARVSVKQFFSGAVNKKRLLGVFKGIVNALLSAEDYMIDEHTIILDLDYIFADVSTCETILICLPIQGATEKHDLGAFFKGIMFSTQFDQTENCDHVARIINYLNSTPLFSLSDFKDLLEKIEQVTYSANQVANDSAPTIKVAPQPVIQPVIQPTVQSKAEVSGSNIVKKTEPTQVDKPVVAPTPAPGTKPPIQPKVSTAGAPVVQSGNAGNEKKISMFGLLMHYSKENKALYEQQKAAKKAGVSTQQQQPSVPQAGKQSVANPGFAVPGMNQGAGSSGFAIPGQPTPMPNAQPATPIKSQPQSAAPVKPQPQQQPVSSVATQEPAYVPRQMPQGQAANFGETTVLGGANIGETTVLTAANNPAQMIAPHLIRKKNNEKISLNKPRFRVGKERSFVDYFIGDNTAISRSHADFISREGEYFVVDMNSTNHTYVNGKMIQSNTETQIFDGDTIRLANEDFEFKLY